MKRKALSPIIFYYYCDLADTEAFCELLRSRFMESGHDRAIIFRSWDCFDGPPGRDGDVFCYDALALTALVDEGYIRVLPDIIDTEKLLDCLDLMEIMADSDFIYDLCTTGGKLQYMLPADASVYPRLAQLDPIYDEFYQIASNEDNGVLRFGKHFFTEYPKKRAELQHILEEELGCDCEKLQTVHIRMA